MSSLGRQLTPYLDSSFKRREAIFSLPRAASVSAVSGRRALTAAISPASAMERVALRPLCQDGIRARGANQCERPQWASEVIGFPSRRSDPIRRHHVFSEQSSVSCTVRRGPQPGAGVYGRPAFETAQAMRASLLAKATAALLWPRVRSNCSAHARSRSGAGAVLVFA
jgi:hypothetical protein